ncbi:MAG: endolytic transglycosylase MltG [Parvularculaceae bacterium]|nr:MAG: endolytic transglycosylase MltG [Parvularculaceae bacterium]
MRSILLFVVSLGLLSVLAVGAGGYLAWSEVNRPGPHVSDTVVLLEEGSSVARIAADLETAGVLRHTKLFIVAARVKGVSAQLKAGEYRIPTGITAWDLVDLIVEGKSLLHYITIAEGLTTAQVIKIVNAHAQLIGELTLTPDEGSLLPETYAFTRGQTRDQIVNIMMKAQSAFVDDMWDDRALELPFASRDAAIILASIVEKETGVASERAQIASVFVNRLKKGMRLESDPTIIYGLTAGEPLGRGLRVSELKRETPYNTYRIRGLPPTPIANPGKDAISAVLNPAQTDDLFFVADGTGGHVFARTLAEHNRNVAQWRRIERERKAAKAANELNTE